MQRAYGPSLIFQPLVLLITVIVFLLLSLISNVLPLMRVGNLSHSGWVLGIL